uniref:NADH-ubiquinone oxidoreductase chain 1 n=1 Tax=Mytella strigata TaxID=3245086 RepID=A0A7T4X9Y0_9BIVA|nr:NADH dehydrogenase subunit 1 [Mytella strigata]QQD89967.1 NADH dehydrogenase subunit 1 [Mytella strigata]WPM98358.1 NADH dehydrogenase subunit 1 [Mytella strigata]
MLKLVAFCLYLITLILPFICVLVSVAFYTLLERKVLGYVMIRKGPNKVGYAGIMQPFSDAGKLFNKEYVKPGFSNLIPFVVCPGVILFTSMLLWFLYPYKYSSLVLTCGVLQFLIVSGVHVYGVMVAGWSSNSKYSLLGAVRGVAQSVSYEVPMTFVLLTVSYCLLSLWLSEVKDAQEGIFSMLSIGLLSSGVWLTCMLAETNRAPFDFVEGESELVSGFNVEYSSGGFAMIFMAEYAAMLFNSIFFVVLFLGGSEMLMSVSAMVWVLFFVWIRGTVPRIRYDQLMGLCWKVLLMVVLVMISLGLMLSCLL